MIKCTACGLEKHRETEFTPNQTIGTKRCKVCVVDSANNQAVALATITCTVCGVMKNRHTDYTERQAVREKRCKECTAGAKTTSGATRTLVVKDFGPGPRDKICEHCGAALFRAEGIGFCCGGGKHVVDFTKYFKPPGRALLDLFRQAWPWRNSHGKTESDPNTGSPTMSGFSNESRIQKIQCSFLPGGP